MEERPKKLDSSLTLLERARAGDRAALDRLAEKFGYCDACGVDLASMLLRKRYNDLVA